MVGVLCKRLKHSSKKLLVCVVTILRGGYKKIKGCEDLKDLSNFTSDTSLTDATCFPKPYVTD